MRNKKNTNILTLGTIILSCVLILVCATTYAMQSPPQKASSLSSLEEKKKLRPEKEERIKVTPPSATLIVKNNEKYPIYLLLNEKKLLSELEAQNVREKKVKFMQLTNQLAIFTLDILEKKEDGYYLLDKIDAKYSTNLPEPSLFICYSKTDDPHDSELGTEIPGKADAYSIKINYTHPLSANDIAIDKVEKMEKTQSGSFLQRITQSGSRIMRPTTPTQPKETPKNP